MGNMIHALLQRFLKSSYWKDISWLALGTLLAQLLYIGIMPVFARLYNPEDFAVSALFQRLLGLLAVFMTFRYEFLVQLPKTDADAWVLLKMVWGIAACMTLMLTPIVYFSRDVIADVVGGGDTFGTWLVFLPVTSAAGALALGMRGFVQRVRMFRRSGESDVVGRLGGIGTILGGYFLLPGAGGLIFGFIATHLSKIAWLLKNIRKPESVPTVNWVELAKRYKLMAGSLMLSHGLLAILHLIPVFVIGKVYGKNTLGQYAQAFSLVSFPTTLLGRSIGNVYYQRAAESWSQGKNFARLWRSTALRLIMIGLPLYLGIAVLMPFLLPIIFGEKWTLAGHFAAIISFQAFFSFITSPMDRGCLVVGAHWYIPLWHGLRVVIAGLVMFIAVYLELSIYLLLVCLAFQGACLYLVDYWAERRFAYSKPVSSKSGVEI